VEYTGIHWVWQILCNFEDPGAAGSYFLIWLRGWAAMVVYGFGFPCFMFYVLCTRSSSRTYPAIPRSIWCLQWVRMLSYNFVVISVYSSSYF
jgi:hypothetical protein